MDFNWLSFFFGATAMFVTGAFVSWIFQQIRPSQPIDLKQEKHIVAANARSAKPVQMTSIGNSYRCSGCGHCAQLDDNFCVGCAGTFLTEEQIQELEKSAAEPESTAIPV
jgi:hypothetical protein